MKEELIKILNAKLANINKNIASLIEINQKIDAENDKLSYATKILSGFKEDNSYNVLNFVKIGKEDFDKIIDIVDDDVKKIFNTGNCNYEGLVYLINGINNGVSLSLTEEQKSSIEYLVRSLIKKQEEYEAVIDGLLLVKDGFAINDVNVLNSEKEEYERIVDKVNNDKYIDETDKICEAIEYSELNKLETIDLLTYLLEYNAGIFGKKDAVKEDSVETENKEDAFAFNPVNTTEIENKEDAESNSDYEFKVEELAKEDTEEHLDTNEKVEDNVDFTDEEKPQEESETSALSDDNEISFEMPIETNEEPKDEEKDADTVNEEIPIVNPFAFEEIKGNNIDDNNIDGLKDDTVNVLDSNDGLSSEDTVDSDVQKNNAEDNNALEENVESEEKNILDENVNNEVNNSNLENNNEIKVEEMTPELFDRTADNENDLEKFEEEKVDDEFKDAFSKEDYYEEYNVTDDKTSNRELQRLFNEYDLKDLEITDDMLLGNADNYKSVLETLKKNDILKKIAVNKELLKEIILSSGEEEINEVLRIIKDDLSVDSDDYEITLNIVINTIPTVFIKDHGNFDNFVNNIRLLKELKVNLISLFDFSKEVLIADNEKALSNYEIVKKYNVNIDYKNAKYLLMLDNLAEKMDYYVESKYQDKLKNEEFDGINYINNYTVKLNSVTDETIKRLRYSSENERKVFGSKPGSLAGEITNLKVNVLELDDVYRNNFFNNEFDGITSDEVKEFVKLIRNSSNVGNYSDELESLEKYHNGLRYDINGVLVSYNKVVRNYNILRSYGINESKALHFAVCYNLIITKDEYANLKSVLNELGGSF